MEAAADEEPHGRVTDAEFVPERGTIVGTSRGMEALQVDAVVEHVEAGVGNRVAASQFAAHHLRVAEDLLRRVAEDLAFDRAQHPMPRARGAATRARSRCIGVPCSPRASRRRRGTGPGAGCARRSARRRRRRAVRRAAAASENAITRHGCHSDGTRTRCRWIPSRLAPLRATTWTSSPAAARPCATSQATRSTPPWGSKRSITRATRTRPWRRSYARRRRARKAMVAAAAPKLGGVGERRGRPAGAARRSAVAADPLRRGRVGLRRGCLGARRAEREADRECGGAEERDRNTHARRVPDEGGVARSPGEP